MVVLLFLACSPPEAPVVPVPVETGLDGDTADTASSDTPVQYVNVAPVVPCAISSEGMVDCWWSEPLDCEGLHVDRALPEPVRWLGRASWSCDQLIVVSEHGDLVSYSQRDRHPTVLATGDFVQGDRGIGLDKAGALYMAVEFGEPAQLVDPGPFETLQIGPSVMQANRASGGGIYRRVTAEHWESFESPAGSKTVIGDRFRCDLDAAGSIECSGDLAAGFDEPPRFQIGVRFDRLLENYSTGGLCAESVEGDVHCIAAVLGLDAYQYAVYQGLGPFDTLGTNVTTKYVRDGIDARGCGIRSSDQKLVCFGYDEATLAAIEAAVPRAAP